MIVRFDLKDRAETVADVHDARIFAGALQHAWATRRQTLQMDFARFVRAMFAPHHRENAKLRDARLTPENFEHARIFIGAQSVFGGNFPSHSDFGFKHSECLCEFLGRRKNRCGQ